MPKKQNISRRGKVTKRTPQKVSALKRVLAKKHLRERPKEQNAAKLASKPVSKLAPKSALKKALEQVIKRAAEAGHRVQAVFGRAWGSYTKRQQVRTVIALGLTAVIVLSVFSIATIYSREAQTSLLQTTLTRLTAYGLLPEKEPITFMATGDILLARYVERNMRTRGDYTFPFLKVAGFLSGADVTFGNLETPLCPGGNTPQGSTTFRGDVEGIEGLLFAGYDVLSVANNHTMNFKADCLLQTINELNKRKIQTAGGGVNQDAAHTPALLEIKGRKIAIQAYDDANIPGYQGFAEWDKPGIALMKIESMQNDVKNALAHGADIVIVSMHAGQEYVRQPNQFKKDFARAAIDAGASAVIGHHPHWVQPCEEYNNGIICYSLGNFVFDQMWSWDTQVGLIAKIIFPAKGKPTLEILPVIIDKTQPRILEGEERQKVMERLGI